MGKAIKSTRIIRRLDDIGRVLIPKEIRKEMCLREGSMLELAFDGDQIFIRKYSSKNSILSKLEDLEVQVCLAEGNDSEINKQEIIKHIKVIKNILQEV